MKTVYKIEGDEFTKEFNLVYETYHRGSRPTQTLRGQRLFNEIIPEEYRKLATELAHKGHRPKEMTSKEMVALYHLVQYCMAL